MYKVVHSVCSETSAITSSIPLFTQFLTDLESTIAELENLTMIHSVRNTGITKQNIQLRKQLMDTVDRIGGLIFAFAVYSNNHHLSEKSNFNLSMLMVMAQADLVSIASQLLNEAKNLGDDLEIIGLKPSDLDEFEKQLARYSVAYIRPRERIVSRKVTTEKIRDEFLIADSLLKKQIDKLMLSFKNTHPEFYYRYRSARIIVNHGVHQKGTTHPVTPENTTTENPKQSKSD